MFLFIGGTTKAGTTSIYNYLKVHPSINQCVFKEPRYFLSKSYPLPKPKEVNRSKENYLKLFKTNNNKNLYIDATPDYLGDLGSAKLIKETLENENIKLIFILRNPITRLVSWYNFAKQIGELDKNDSFEDYIKWNVEPPTPAPLHLRALEQGRYILYLKEYLRYFDRDQVKIILFEEFINNEEKIIKDICNFCKLDQSFYDNFNFIKYNESFVSKRPRLSRLYRKLFYNAKLILAKHGATFNLIQKIYLAVKKQYPKLSSKKKNANTFKANNISPKSLRFLKTYYFEYNKMFEDSFDIKNTYWE